MTDFRSGAASLVDRSRVIAAGGSVFGAHFLRDTAVLVLGEEKLVLLRREGEPQSVAVHGGGILGAASDGARVVTGGDDGKVVATDASGTTSVIATDAKRRWIDQVAVSADGGMAWSAGKQVFVRTAKGEERSLDIVSAAGGLAFAPKGFRLVIAHYGGASLWFPNAPQAKPERLEWKGSHLGATISPDGRFLVTSMQEPMLHGWRIADAKDMRMSGYATRVRSTAWTAGGKWLATSGSTQLVLWPFQSKDGPMGKQPRLLSPTQARLDMVAAHPREDIVALGFGDGIVLLVRIDDGAEILVRKPGGAITALAWDASGGMLVWGTDDGEAGLLVL